MRPALRYYYYSGSGGEQYTNWWQGIGDVVPLSTNYTVYDPVAAADLASSYINLANPGTRDAIAPVAEPAHAQGEGWTFNGTTQYLDSNTKLGDESTIVIWIEDAAGVYAAGYFEATAPTRFCLIRPINGNNTSFHKGAGASNLFHQTRGSILGMNNLRGFRNGQSVVDLQAWTGGTPNLNVIIGAENNDGSVVNNFYSGRILRVAMYDIALTDAQMEAVALAMFDYNQPANHSYTQTVLSLNPICYWPMNQAIGSPLFDISGNKAHGMSYYLPVGQPGKYGNAVSGVSDEVKYVTGVDGWPTKTGINLNEFSCAGWVKINNVPANQVRPFNHRVDGGLEYCTLEVRNGLGLCIFNKENGATEDSTIFPGVNMTDGVWQHIVMYNSLSAGKYGFYLDGVNHEFPKTLTGFSTTAPQQVLAGQEMDGSIQHIAWFDHALNQAEVNSLQ